MVGVVITVREQQRGSLLEEFQRQFAIQSQRVETLLAEEPAETSPEMMLLIQRLAPSKSIASLLKRIGLHVMREPDKDPNIQAQNDTLDQAALPAMKRQLNAIQIELQHLIWCLGNYRDNGGSEILVALYTRRYEPFVCWMYVLGLLESEPVEDWFRPTRFHDAWRSANGDIARVRTPTSDGSP